MSKLTQIYEEVKAILDLEQFTLNDMTLYEELIEYNKVYKLGIDNDTIEKLHKLATDYYLKYEGNTSMYNLASAILNYYKNSDLNYEEFILNFNKWAFFDYINE